MQSELSAVLQPSLHVVYTSPALILLEGSSSCILVTTLLLLLLLHCDHYRVVHVFRCPLHNMAAQFMLLIVSEMTVRLCGSPVLAVVEWELASMSMLV